MPSYDRSGASRTWIELQLSRPGVLLATLSLLGLAAVVIVGLMVLREPRDAPARLGLLPARLEARTFAVCVVQAFAVFLASAGLGVLLTHLHVLPELAPSTFARALATGLYRCGPAMAAALSLAHGVFPGVGEELMFRGFVQRGLARRWRPAAAILVTSALFAVWHGHPVRILYAFALGGWLGWLAWRLDSIVPGMVLHGLLNTVVSAVGWLLHHGRALPQDDGGLDPESVAFLVVGAASLPVVVAAQRWLARELPSGRRPEFAIPREEAGAAGGPAV